VAQNLTELENLCCLANVSENSFGYVTSPVVRWELKRSVCGSGSTDLIWPQLTRPLSSNVINIYQKIRILVHLLCCEPGRKKFYSTWS
jgi:hypothetical protein